MLQETLPGLDVVRMIITYSCWLKRLDNLGLGITRFSSDKSKFSKKGTSYSWWSFTNPFGKNMRQFVKFGNHDFPKSSGLKKKSLSCQQPSNSISCNNSSVKSSSPCRFALMTTRSPFQRPKEMRLFSVLLNSWKRLPKSRKCAVNP